MVGFHEETIIAPALLTLSCITIVHCLGNRTTHLQVGGTNETTLHATNKSMEHDTLHEEPTESALGNETVLIRVSTNTTEPPNATDTSATQAALEEEPIQTVHTNRQLFFSKVLMQHLREWNDTIRNASTECSKTMLGAIHGSHWSIDFPVFASNRRCRPNVRFLPVAELNPLLVRRSGRKTLVNIASLALLELSPLLVLCLSCATLSGMIIWALVSAVENFFFLILSLLAVLSPNLIHFPKLQTG